MVGELVRGRGASATGSRGTLRAARRPRRRAASGDRARARRSPAWRRLLEALAEQRPLVLVFEDLHWADDGLLDFVDHLADWATGVPLLIVGTARPGAARPAARLGRRQAERGDALDPAAVGGRDGAAPARALLDRAVLAARDAAGGAARAPRATRSTPRSTRGCSREHAHGDDLPLPETVQGMIAARHRRARRRTRRRCSRTRR